jgi:hypothetical protein
VRREQLAHTLPELSESVASYMSSAAEKLRRENSVCEAIQVFVQTNPFGEQDHSTARTPRSPPRYWIGCCIMRASCRR